MDILTLELVANDVKALGEFYGAQLGFATSLSQVENSLTIDFGSSKLHFTHDSAHSGSYHFAVNVPSTRFAAAFDFMRSSGVELFPDSSGNEVFEFEEWNATALYFHDPSGNIVEFISRRDLPSPTTPVTGTFSMEEVLSISEIGLTCFEPETVATEICSIVGIDRFKSSSAEFVAMGDDRGLLILAKAGRFWYPTSSIATDLPFKVTILNPVGKKFEISKNKHSSNAEIRQL